MWLLLAACEPSSPSLPDNASPRHQTTAEIPSGPIRGELRGKGFEVGSARFVVHRQIGRERIDISLSEDTEDRPCAHVGSAQRPSVWLRFRGTKLPAPGEHRLAVGENTPAFEVHYQQRVDGAWLGSGRAGALLVIHDAERTALSGELSVCFADGFESCVAGAFQARWCEDHTAPDVRDLRRLGAGTE